MIIVSNVEDHLRSVSINSSKSIKNPLGYNSPASQLYHRKKFIFLTKSKCTISGLFYNGYSNAF